MGRRIRPYARTLARASLIALLAVSLTLPSAALADDGAKREYSVLAVGDYTVLNDLTFEDSNEFASCFGGYGPAGLAWKRIQYDRDGAVQYWEFSDRPGYTEADQGDILYFMGHGWSATTWNGETIYSPLGLQKFKDSRYSTSDSRGYVNHYRVGTWSSSRWDDDLDWAIFATCSTLANNGSARRWGYTLYNGMRAILGYRQLSYGYPDDYRIIANWEDRVRGIGRSPQRMIQAWYQAHAQNPYYLRDRDNWAAVGHDNNFYDYLWGIGTNNADVRGSISDVRYYDYTNYAGHGVRPSTASVASGATATAGAAVTARAVGGRSASTTLKAAVPAAPKKAAIMRAPKSGPSPTVAARRALGATVRAKRIKGRGGPFTTFRRGKTSVLAHDTGAQTIETPMSTKRTGLSPEDAERVARSYVERVWGMPEDAELRSVGALRGTRLFDDRSRPIKAEPEVISYRVEFGRSLNDVPVVGSERITIDVQDSGVIGAYRSWHDLKTTDGGHTPISGDDALDRFTRNIDKLLPVAGQDLDIDEVRFAYRATPHDSDGSATLRPVWRIGFRVKGTADHTSPTEVDVDALDGVILR